MVVFDLPLKDLESGRMEVPWRRGQSDQVTSVGGAGLG